MEMNTKDETIKRFIETMTGLLQSGKDFVLEQAPDVMRQIVLKEQVSYGWIFLCSSIATYVCYRLYRNGSESVKQDRYGVDGMGQQIFGGIGIALAAISAVTSAHYILTITVAPKVFLIEYFARLAK